MIEAMKLNVSKGQTIPFESNGKSVSGLVVASEPAGIAAFVTVETGDGIPNGAALTLSGYGGIGVAFPTLKGNRVLLVLKIPLSAIDLPTIGK
ncbi:MAG: hypothetical protein ABSH19_08850 [Opitutales bacterium]|jgi:hypothetical protein